MTPERHAAPAFYDEVGADDRTTVERIFAHCREVVAASRERRLEACARWPRYAARVALACRRAGRQAPRVGVPRCLNGGAGLLDGARVMLTTDDVDTRDLMRLLLHWYGAEVAAVTTTVARSLAATFRPHLTPSRRAHQARARPSGAGCPRGGVRRPDR